MEWLGNLYIRWMGIMRVEIFKMIINRGVDKYMWYGYMVENFKDIKRNEMDLYILS